MQAATALLDGNYSGGPRAVPDRSAFEIAGRRERLDRCSAFVAAASPGRLAVRLNSYPESDEDGNRGTVPRARISRRADFLAAATSESRAEPDLWPQIREIH